MYMLTSTCLVNPSSYNNIHVSFNRDVVLQKRDARLNGGMIAPSQSLIIKYLMFDIVC